MEFKLTVQLESGAVEFVTQSSQRLLRVTVAPASDPYFRMLLVMVSVWLLASSGNIKSAAGEIKRAKKRFRQDMV